MKNTSLKTFHKYKIKRTVLVKATKEKAWKKISNIVGLNEWVINVKKTVYLSKLKRGVGSVRNISFRDGSEVEEHIVLWKEKRFFSYVAISGLPLRVYHATISLEPKTSKLTRISWETYLHSKKMTKKEFNEFVSFLGEFYQRSLNNLKTVLEK